MSMRILTGGSCFRARYPLRMHQMTDHPRGENHMKKLTALALMAAFSVISTAALAEGPEGQGPGPGPAGPPPHHEGKFNKIDQDKDGYLTRKEIDAFHQQKLDKFFGKADTDKDGRISRDEGKAAREEMHEKMRKRFEHMKE